MWRWRSTRRGARGATARLFVNFAASILFAYLAYVVFSEDGGPSGQRAWLAPLDGASGGAAVRRRAAKAVAPSRATDDGRPEDSGAAAETASLVDLSTGDMSGEASDAGPPQPAAPAPQPQPAAQPAPPPPPPPLPPAASRSGTAAATATRSPAAATATRSPAAAVHAPAAGGGGDLPPAHPPIPVEATHETAYVTMASGNEAGRMAVTMVRSLLDTGTDPSKVDIVVLLPRGGVHSPECNSEAWRASMKLPGQRCAVEPERLPDEIISPHLVAALRRMGAKLVLIDAIPRTAMTEGIPGGKASFWGMALNKLVVFNMTMYRKIVWMDSDTYALKNLDHLFGPEYVTFTGALTEACCLQNGPGIPSGGLWVLEPSIELGIKLWQLMLLGAPKFDKGLPVLGPNGKQAREFWRLGDMHIVRHLFSDWPRDYTHYRLFPWIIDNRHGYPAGLRQLPLYAAMDEATWNRTITDPRTGSQWAEGFRGELVAPEDAHRPVWRALPIVYDQCVSQCKCLPWRWPAPGVFYSVHFSCLQDGIQKPGHYDSEHAFMSRLLEEPAHCLRYLYLQWYDTYRRAVGDDLEGPRWTGADVRASINMSLITSPPTRIYEVTQHRRRRRRR